MIAASREDAVVVRRVLAPFASLPSQSPGYVDWQARTIAVFMAVGIAVRLIRYSLRFPLWADESFLAVNLLHRGYADLMRPLDCHQVAPLLFLWTELTAVKLLGFNEWSLRLFPMLSGVASIFLFHRLAAHLLRGTAKVLAVAIFAVTYSAIRYACEVKPYGIDLMISTLILLLTVRWWKRPEETRQLWALTAVIPLALGLSFPAVFVAGGTSLAIAAVLVVSPSRRGWSAWTAYNAVVVGSFFAWYWLGMRAQAQAELGVMAAGWSDAFPPRDSVFKLAVWLVRVHAGPLMAVPVGGDNWGSTATLLLCLAVAATLLRQARYRLLLLFTSPFILNLVAAALNRYPYGGHMRLAMHLVPIVCILAGLGAAEVLRLVRWTCKSVGSSVDGLGGPSYRRSTTIVLVCLFTLAIVFTARDFYLPGKEQSDIRKRDFAAWLWSGLERGHEVVCLGEELPPPLPSLGKSAHGRAAPQFLCNEQIYSPRHIHGEPCDLSLVSREHPLACVQYWSHLAPYDPAELDRWLAAMQTRYDLIASDRYPLLQDNDNDRQPEPADRVEVYEFVPKAVKTMPQ
jgi:hypothetical protein